MKRIIAYITFFFLAGSLWGQHYRIGDLYTAPDGSQGIIFYLHPDGSGGWVVALQDASSSCRWSQNTTIIPGLNHFLDQCDEWCLDAYQLVYADTAGYTNTQIIRSSLSTQNSIAATVVDFQNGWYLPAIGQLLKLYASRPFIEQEIIAAGGSFPAGQYWSSTLQNNNHAWMITYGRPGDMPRQLRIYKDRHHYKDFD